MIDLNTLTGFNEWWTSGQVPAPFLGKHPRPLFENLKKYLPKRQILLIYGLRRVGKTFLFYHLIQYLLNQRVDPVYIFYFSFDEKKGTIDDLVKTYQEKVLKKDLLQAKKVYFFLDEIQKIKDWQDKVKLLYDRYPNLKIFLSGSASVALQKKSKESLAGRLYDFQLMPLSLNEFLTWREVEVNQTSLDLYQAKIYPLFLDYLRKGGFPELTQEQDDEIIKNYLKNTVLERIVYQDLPLEFGLKDPELLKTLIEMVGKMPGLIINYDRLARDLGRSKVTIINYIEYLKYALIFQELKNLRPGFLVSSRKGKKIYPTTTAFCFVYQDDFYQEQTLQRIAETAVVNFLQAQYFFRNQFEVDVILKQKGEILPIEVKYGQPETKSLLKFLEKFQVKKGVLITKENYQQGKNVQMIPLWRFLLGK